MWTRFVGLRIGSSGRLFVLMIHKNPPLLPILNLIARPVTGSCVLMTVSSGEMSCADDIEQWRSVIPIIVNSGALLFIDDRGQWRAVFC